MSFKIFSLICLLILSSCDDRKVDSFRVIDNKPDNKSPSFAIVDKSLEEDKITFISIINNIPNDNIKSKYDEIEELSDSFIMLGRNESRMLSLEVVVPKYEEYGSNWFINGKSESNNYYSLYLYNNLESLKLFQINYSKIDSSLIDYQILSDFFGTCNEYEYIYSRIKNDTFYKYSIAEYDECKDDSCISYVDSTLVISVLNDVGKFTIIGQFREKKISH